jgi:hypothetical protein
LRKATFGFWAMSDRLIRQNEQSTLGLVSAFNKGTIFHLHKLVIIDDIIKEDGKN